MTEQELQELAQEAGFEIEIYPYKGKEEKHISTTDGEWIGEELHRFADLVEKALIERLLKDATEKPIGWIAWEKGEAAWSEDCVCHEPVYPVDGDDTRTSMPLYTGAQVAAMGLQKAKND
jgi:hypothetical protein